MNKKEEEEAYVQPATMGLKKKKLPAGDVADHSNRFQHLLMLAEVTVRIHAKEKAAAVLNGGGDHDDEQKEEISDPMSQLRDEFSFPTMQKGKRMKRKRRAMEPKIISHEYLSVSAPLLLHNQMQMQMQMQMQTQKPRLVLKFRKTEDGSLRIIRSQPTCPAPGEEERSLQKMIMNRMLMPQDLRDYIRGIHGGDGATSDFQFVMQKVLTGTDVSSSHSRLSLPFMQLKADFLTAEEKETVSTRNADDKKKPGAINVALHVPPSTHSITVGFKQWDMRKKTGKVSSSYVLVAPWNAVVKQNGLKKGESVSLWSFRCGSQLCLALVR